jgi:type I restriction enzyme S subunit
MNTNWPRIKLTEVLELDLDRIDIDSSETYEMVGVYSFGRGLFHREPVQGSNTSYKSFYRLKADHVVMSQLFGWEGALALSSAEFAGRYVSPQFPTFRCKSDRLERSYLGWYIQRRAFWDDLGKRTRGMGDRRRTLSPEALLNCEIPLPSLDEQRRIIARIKELSTKIEEARSLQQQVQEECEILCRSIVLSGSCKPTPMRTLVRLRECDVIVRAEENYDFAGVYCFGKGVFKGQRKSGSQFAYSKLTRLKAGNFVYPKLMAWEGALGIVPQDCEGLFVSPEFPVFELDESRVLPETLDVYFRMPSVWPELAAISTGTNVRRRRLHPSAFLNFEVPLPSMETQMRLRNLRQVLTRLKPIQVQAAAELNALMPSILSKAFAGELKR